MSRTPDAPDRTTTVSPERLPGWIERFAASHGEVGADAEGHDLRLRAADGSRALLVDPWGSAAAADGLDAWLAEVARPRTVGVLLVRRGAHAVGVARGTELLAHHTDTHYVQGRTKAGGWSQQRYARRRANQADHAFGAASDDLVRVVLPHLGELDALVCGGDRAGVDAAFADPRLARLAGLRTAHLLVVPEPRLAVLQDAVERLRHVPVQVFDPPEAAAGPS